MHYRKVKVGSLHIPGSGFIVACRLRLVLLTLPAKLLVIEASAVGAPQTGQLPSCTDSCTSADRIRTHTITAIFRLMTYHRGYNTVSCRVAITIYLVNLINFQEAIESVVDLIIMASFIDFLAKITDP